MAQVMFAPYNPEHISMSDDSNELIELMRSSGGASSGPSGTGSGQDKDDDPRLERRDSIEVVFITFGLFIAGFILFIALKDFPGGIQIVALVGYTVLIPYLASDRFLNYVPWDLLTSKRSLLGHLVALGAVYGITTWLLAAKPHLPDWFNAEHHKGSLFYWSFCVILLALAFCEWAWISRRGDKGRADSGQDS